MYARHLYKFTFFSLCSASVILVAVLIAGSLHPKEIYTQMIVVLCGCIVGCAICFRLSLDLLDFDLIDDDDTNTDTIATIL